MTRVDFYHLQKQTLDEVLPKLLEKAYDTKQKILVKIGNDERVEFINSLLWTYNDQSFLPHGSKKDGNAELQPIWLTADDTNANNASLLFLADGAEVSTDTANQFERIFNIFDGNNPDAVQKSREFWKALKNAGHECHYWQQDVDGKWKSVV